MAPPIRRMSELGPRYLPRGRHAAEAPVVPCGEIRSAAPVPIQFNWTAMRVFPILPVSYEFHTVQNSVLGLVV